MTRVLVCFSVVALLAGQVSGDLFSQNLFEAGAEGWVNGGHFLQIDPKGTGTGVLEPFVRLDNASQPIVEGYNTDGRLDAPGTPAPFDAKSDAQYTHAVLAASIPTIDIGGTTYWHFYLDINQTGGAPRLTLNELQIYRGDLQNVVTQTLGSDGTLTDLGDPVWDLDVGPFGNSQINLDASIAAPGQGSADMFADIPVTGAGEWLLLYSQFGNGSNPATNYTNNDGYEEWGVAGTAGVVPVPGAVLLGVLGLGAAGLRLRRFA